MAEVGVIIWTVISVSQIYGATYGIIVGPRNTTAVAGQSTFLNCSTSDPSKGIAWYYDAIIQQKRTYIYSENLVTAEYKSRAHIDRQIDTGEINLVIHEVQKTDAGKYTCQEERGKEPLSHKSAELVVLDAAPICRSNISGNEVIRFHRCGGLKTENVQISCKTAYSGNIPPSFEWIRNNEEHITNGVHQNISANNLTSVLIILGDKIESGSFICQTERSAAEQYACSPVAINVKHVSDNFEVKEKKEGDEVNCSVNSSQDCSFKWIISDDNHEKVVSENLKLKLPGPGMYRCEAECKIKGNQYPVLAGQTHVTNNDDSTKVIVLAIFLCIFVVLCVAQFVFICLRVYEERWQKLLKVKSSPHSEGIPLISSALTERPWAGNEKDEDDICEDVDVDPKFQLIKGPYTHHLYIGFAKEDKSTVMKLRKELYKHGVKCCLRAINGAVLSSIQQGVAESQKCMLFMTSDYLNDPWYQIETEAVLDKAKQFSCDVVLIMKTSIEQIVPEEFKNFNKILITQELLTDEKSLVKLSEVIAKEPIVKLDVLPMQNSGISSAFGFYYGFLRLVLPEFKKRLLEETLKNDSDLARKTIKKMLIILPESCYCPPQIIYPGKIEFTGKYVVRIAHRAGNEKRDFKSSLFKLIGQDNEEYYFVGELATPLLTMFETYYYGLGGMTKDQLNAERDTFYFTLKAILSHSDNSYCKDQFKLLYWSDRDTGKRNRQDLYDFLLPVLKEELVLEREKESQILKTGSPDHTPSFKMIQPIFPTFMILPFGGNNPAQIYDEVPKYPMNTKPRGICLIVSIENFDKGLLTPRRGSDKDTDALGKLFKRLLFKVETHKDLNAETLESLFLTKSHVDHKDYDAIVCCILSHGNLGEIYTRDGKSVEILNLVNFFTDKNCPSLKNKPKMFFIQACQGGEPESGAPQQIRTEESKTHNSSGDFKKFAKSDVEHANQIPSSLDEVIAESTLEQDAVGNLEPSILNPLNKKHKGVLVPGFPDFLMSYSTLPGSVSYRDTQMGSLYIQALSKFVGQGKDLERELKDVSGCVKQKLHELGKAEGNEDMSQLPFHLTSGMDRLIYL